VASDYKGSVLRTPSLH